MQNMISATAFTDFAKRAKNKGESVNRKPPESLTLLKKAPDAKRKFPRLKDVSNLTNIQLKPQNGNETSLNNDNLKPPTINRETSKQDEVKLAKVVATARGTIGASEKFMAGKNIRSKLKSQMRKIAQERLTVKQVFSRYVESSTLHGFRYACSDTFLIRRIIWAVLMVVGALYFLIKLRGGIYEYIQYPFSTLSTLEFVETLTFPAISFCAINQYKLSKLKNSSLYPLFLENRLPLHKNWSDPVMDMPGHEFVEEMKNISFSVDDVFLSCEYMSADTAHPEKAIRNCSKGNFTSYFSEKGERCFTLNPGTEKHPMLEINMEGLNNAIEIIFDMNNFDSVMDFDYTGMQVIIHDQSEPPVSKTGFFLPPGTKTFASLSKTETENLPPPYATECGEIQLKYYKKYNQKACLLEKLTDYVGEKCNCRESYMPDNGKLFCSVRETILCSFPLKEEFNEYAMRGACPIDCKSVSFTSMLSSTPFIQNPLTGIEERMIQQQIDIKGYSHHIPILEMSKKMSTEELESYIEENIVVALFYFADMSKRVNIQEATLDFYQFLGDMGGEIGLMLGASLLTFFEFVDLIGFLGYHQLLRLNKEKKEKHRQSLLIKRQSMLTTLDVTLAKDMTGVV